MNAVVESTLTRAALPAIGAPLLNGTFGGISMHEDQLVALVLLPDEGGNLDHASATAWAASLGAALPSRIDMLVLYRNRKAVGMESGWHWTSETGNDDADYAWDQSFDFGFQINDLKSYDFRCRAVRRVAL